MIRQATEDDIPAIVAMGERFYNTTHYPQAVGSYDAATAEGLIRMMVSPGVLLLAEHRGETVGMVGLVIPPWLFNAQHRVAAEIMWWTAEESRNTGAGLALLRAVAPACKAAGCKAVQMVRLESSPAHVGRLYERLGYRLAEHSYIKVL